MNQLSTIQSTIIDPAKSAFLDDETFRREAEFAMQAFNKNKFLADVALKNPNQAIAAVKNIAGMGLSLNPASQLAYLIPRGGAICLDISYKGMLKAAIEDGACRMAKCGIVYESDEFQLNGISEEPTHSYDPFSSDRGKMIGVYACLKLNDKDYYTETMNVDEVNKIRNLSASGKSGKSPWVDFYDRMAIKTVLKRALNFCKGRSPKVDNMIQYLNDEAGEGIDFHAASNVIEGESEVLDEKSPLEKLKTCISLCESMEELESFLPDIKALDDKEREKIRTIYKEISSELQKDIKND